MNAHRLDPSGDRAPDREAHEAFRQACRRRRDRPRGPRGRGLRLPRAERRREDDDASPRVRAHRTDLGDGRGRRLPARRGRREDRRGRRHPHRAAGTLRAPVRVGEPRVLRDAVRPSVRRRREAGRALPPPHGPLGAAAGADGDLLPGDEAEDGDRPCRATRAAHPVPRRADDRSRSRRGEDGARLHRGAAWRGSDRVPVHAQPRRGRPALRPYRVLPPQGHPYRQPRRAAGRALRARDRDPAPPRAQARGPRAREGGRRRARGQVRERLDHRPLPPSAAPAPAAGAPARRGRGRDRVRARAARPARGRVPAHRRGSRRGGRSPPRTPPMSVVARTPERTTLVRAVCVREWREAIGNKLLVGMTLLPPVVILGTGVLAVAAAAINPPSERDIQALYSAAPAVRGLDPVDAVQGFIATYFLILFMLIPTVVPLTMAIYSVIGEKSMRTLEPLLATAVGVGDLLFAKSLASTVPSSIVTWTADPFYLTSVVLLPSRAAVNALIRARWELAILVMVPLLTLLSVNLGILISTRVNDVRVAQQIGGLVVVPVVAIGIAQVTGRVVLDNGAFLQMTTVLIVLDLAVFWLAKIAFQRENILVRWR